MQKVLTAAQMREVDRRTTEEYGIPSIILMENAAHAVARVITEKLGGSVKGKSILILCGPGNNGGDGAALARILWQQGAELLVCSSVRANDAKGDAAVNFEAISDIAIGKASSADSSLLVLSECPTTEIFGEFCAANFSENDPDFIVDALLGTGLTRPTEGVIADMARWVRGFNVEGVPQDTYVLSIDIPTGINADSGEWVGGAAVRAHTTVTFTAPKPANLLPPASGFSGDLVVASIGSPQALINEASSPFSVAEKDDVQAWFRKSEFTRDSYKNKRGHALLIAGSKDYTGAAVLCGNAAIRSGVGLVTLACPADANAEIASRLLPEVILSTVESADLTDHVSKADAIAVGCGLDANDAKIEETVRDIVANRSVPVVIDASALWLYSPFDTQAENHPVGEAPTPLLRKEGSPLILTPHEGEFMRLLGTEDKQVIKDRVAAVRDFATKNNVILVLKGERILIGAPDGRVIVNPTGNSGLGKAGNGDTLTGILVGFVAQAVQMKIDLVDTVVAACYVAGMAGDIAEKKYGKRVMTASDVRECLAEVFSTLEAI